MQTPPRRLRKGLISQNFWSVGQRGVCVVRVPEPREECTSMMSIEHVCRLSSRLDIRLHLSCLCICQHLPSFNKFSRIMEPLSQRSFMGVKHLLFAAPAA